MINVKFKTTDNSNEIASHLPESLLDTLNPTNEDLNSPFSIPRIDLSNLLTQIYEVQEMIGLNNPIDVQAEDFKFHKLRANNFANLFSCADIWLVTDEDCGKPVPDDETDHVPYPREGFERLGCYVPATQRIFLWVDKISEYCYSRLLFQQVLIHEIIHLILDVAARDEEYKGIKIESSIDDIDEETLDNILTLYAYRAAIYPNELISTIQQAWIRDFMRDQPSNYSAALAEYNSTEWFEVREMIKKKLIKKLLKNEFS